MGAADVVPGVSGGTVALVLGIYEHLVETIRDGARALGALLRGNVSDFWKRVKAVDWIFLVPLLAGILLAVVSLASLIETQLHDNPEEMAGLFFGLVIASSVVAWRLLKHWVPAHLAMMTVVAVAVFAILGLQSGPVSDPSPLMFLGAGVVAICAMILPGISGSFLLLMLGMYGAVINVVDERLLGDAAVFGIGAVIGLSLFSSVLGVMLDKAHDWVMAALIGLMIGSLRVLWPWPNGVGIISDIEDEVVSGTSIDWPAGDEWFAPTALAVLAFAVVIAFSIWAEKRDHQTTR